MAMDHDARLQELEDIEEIRTLTHRYAWYVARAENEQIGTLFTEDGSFEAVGSENVKVQGRETLVAFLARLKADGSVPLVLNHIIDVDGDAARSVCKMFSPWQNDKGAFYGFYEDTLKRVDGKWLFGSRRFTFHERP